MPTDLQPDIGVFHGRVHHYPVRVFYEDTDFSGVVYYANYLRFFERARSSFFRLAGIGHAELLERDPPLAFVIRKVELEYKRPARIDDALVVRTAYDRYNRARLFVSQSIWRGEELMVTADSEATCIDLSGRPRRAPPFMMDALRPYLLPEGEG